MLSEWDTNSAGSVWLTPLIRADAVHLHEVGVGLRLEVLSGPEESKRQITPFQVSMDAGQALDLIERLQLVVDYIRTRRPNAPTN